MKLKKIVINKAEILKDYETENVVDICKKNKIYPREFYELLKKWGVEKRPRAMSRLIVEEGE